MASHGHHEVFELQFEYKDGHSDHLQAVGSVLLKRNGGPATYGVSIPISFNTQTTDSKEAKKKTHKYAKERLKIFLADIHEAVNAFEPDES